MEVAGDSPELPIPWGLLLQQLRLQLMLRFLGAVRFVALQVMLGCCVVW